MPRAFAHPLWWGALGLLALNDHVLKGSGLLPGSWTGKLSDFAGVVVAPPLLAWLFGARRRYSAALAAGLVAAGLCTIDLVPAASRALEQALAALGLPSRLWPDPSDLWALALLPLGFALSRVPVDRADRAGRGWALAWRRAWQRPLVQRTAIALGACACLATAGDEDDGDGRTDVPEVENKTDSTVVFVLAATEGAGGCALYRNDRIGALTRPAFGTGRVVTLEAGERTRLTTGDDPLACGAASLRLADGNEAFVFWRDLEKVESFVSPNDDRRVARRVVIAGKPNRWELEVGTELARFDVDDEPPAPSCPELAAQPSLEFSALADAQGFFQLSEIRTAMDGCFELDWFAPAGDTEVDTQRLCVPDWAFPFEQGETLVVTQEIGGDEGRVLHVGRLEDGELETELVVWNGVAAAAGSRVSKIEPVDCVGAISECGAYVRPIELSVRGHDETLRSGDEVEVDGGPPKRTRVLAGTGSNVAWPAPACAGEDAQPGTRASLLELRKY